MKILSPCTLRPEILQTPEIINCAIIHEEYGTQLNETIQTFPDKAEPWQDITIGEAPPEVKQEIKLLIEKSATHYLQNQAKQTLLLTTLN